ncbi:MAG: type II secretion system protein [Candidatus Taylorbacteria bacterium]
MNLFSLKNNKIKKYSRAFTLIEMIVSLAVFSIVAVVALGALMKIISANRKAQTLQSAMTNMNFVLESMSREMRVGSRYVCVNGEFSGSSLSNLNADACSAGLYGDQSNDSGITIAFASSHTPPATSPVQCNLIYAYYLEPPSSISWNIKKAIQTSCNTPINSYDYASVIDKKVILTGWYLKIIQDYYPFMAIRLSGYVGELEKERTYFDVQTGVSSRLMTVYSP